MMARAILEALAASGHGAHAAEVEALIQPGIWLRATCQANRPPPDPDHPEPLVDTGDPRTTPRFASLDLALAALPLGASRFGGVPDLPPGVAWPARDDVPMEFVAQLRLADCAAHDPLGRLPATGHLWFFYNSQWLTFDRDGDRACCAVLYHDVADDQLVRHAPPRVDYQGEYDDGPRLAPCVHGLATLELATYPRLPASQCAPWITPALDPFWYAFTDAYRGLTEPPFTGEYQHNWLLGYVSAPDWVGAHAHGTDDQLLLQVDSDGAAHFQWGDCDRLYFLIDKAALAARDFTKVRLYSLLG